MSDIFTIYDGHGFAINQSQTGPRRMSEMVERVARAIHAAEYPTGSYEGFVAHTPDPQKFIRQARAAIEAMREPTPEMVKAAREEEYYDGTYESMIDVALGKVYP